MSFPRISVIIPTCNRNDALAQCLDRLAPGAQTLPASDYEVIVSDDGSNANAQPLVRDQYAWARWSAGPKRGPAANRNAGAARAHGEFLAFTDDDCLPAPGWLEGYADAIHDDREVYEGETAATGSLRAPFVIAPVNSAGGMLWSCNMMVSRAVFEELNGFDEGFPHAADEDTDFCKRVKKADHKIHFVPDALIYHPPVRRIWGRKSARLWESKVRLAYKAEPSRSPFTRHEMVWLVFRTRIRQLKNADPSMDWLLGVGGMLVEILWVARGARRWDRKHRLHFASANKKAQSV